MTHACGGKILTGWSDNWRTTTSEYQYCHQCGAFAYQLGGAVVDVPGGDDRKANRAAWDAGQDCSPPTPMTTEDRARAAASTAYHGHPSHADDCAGYKLRYQVTSRCPCEDNWLLHQA